MDDGDQARHGRQFSLRVMGAAFPNRKGGGDRRFEILLCVPGEPAGLALEPHNPADPDAVAVHSARGVQIGYLSAERAPWIAGMLRGGREVRAIFQQALPGGAAVRIALNGADPVLPPAAAAPVPAAPAPDDSGFWPDPIPPDE